MEQVSMQVSNLFLAAGRGETSGALTPVCAKRNVQKLPRSIFATDKFSPLNPQWRVVDWRHADSRSRCRSATATSEQAPADANAQEQPQAPT